MRLPAPLPLVAVGWMLTGNATKAADELSPPPPPVGPPTAPAPAVLGAEGWLNGKSPPIRLEKIGGKLENMFGVVSERTGVVRDSVVVVVREVVELTTPPTIPPVAWVVIFT